MNTNLQPSIKTPSVFAFRGFETDDESGQVKLHYAYENGLEFCEKFDFDHPLPSRTSPLRHGFEAALEGLHIAAGVSYYKAFLPQDIVFQNLNLTLRQRRFFQELYVSGLGEFAYRNGINVAKRVNFLESDIRQPRPDLSSVRADSTSNSTSLRSMRSATRESNPGFLSFGQLPRKSAVLIGGGKDSLVSVEILRRSNEPMVLLGVNPKQPIVDCALASGLPFLSVSRQIDPRLFELNDIGALNGHIPITAIVSFTALTAAFVYGYDTVVLSNERSANEGNIIHEGQVINHQYSKTANFERDIRDYISAHISPQLNYFSLLRPLSELHIAQLMVRTTRYDECFTSCNSAFRIRQTEAAARWCRDCPKCRFTFLILAAAIAPNRLCGIFGANLLDQANQVSGYEELVGLSGHKPWECVGEIAESSAAIVSLASDPAWANSVVVRQLAPRIRQVMHCPEDVWNELLTPSSDHYLPKRYEGMLYEFIGAR